MISEGASASIAKVRSCGIYSLDSAMPALQRCPAYTGVPCVSFLRVTALALPLPPWRDTGRIGYSTTDPVPGSTRWLHDDPQRLCARVRPLSLELMVGCSRKSPIPSARRRPGFSEVGVTPPENGLSRSCRSDGQRVAFSFSPVKPKKKAEAVNLGSSLRVGIGLSRPLRCHPWYPYHEAARP